MQNDYSAGERDKSIMTTPWKKVSGLILLVVSCYALLCINYCWIAGSPSYMSDAATTLVAALVGGVAAGGYLNFIGMRARERE